MGGVSCDTSTKRVLAVFQALCSMLTHTLIFLTHQAGAVIIPFSPTRRLGYARSHTAGGTEPGSNSDPNSQPPGLPWREQVTKSPIPIWFWGVTSQRPSWGRLGAGRLREHHARPPAGTPSPDFLRLLFLPVQAGRGHIRPEEFVQALMNKDPVASTKVESPWTRCPCSDPLPPVGVGGAIPLPSAGPAS